MKIAGFQKNSTIDFPGKLSCVIFVAGCNYNCYYCHNKHLLESQEKVYEEEVFAFLKKRQGLIEGMVITGGEPSLYEDLPNFVSEVKKLGYTVKLDTHGSNPDMVRRLISENLLDFIAVDYKAPLHKYDLIGACKNTEENEVFIRETINYIMNSDIDYEIRTTLIPEIKDDDLLEMALSFPKFKSYILQKYRPVHDDPGEGEDRIIYKKEDVERMAEIISPHQPNISIRA